jgi:hypothetical protein
MLREKSAAEHLHRAGTAACHLWLRQALPCLVRSQGHTDEAADGGRADLHLFKQTQGAFAEIPAGKSAVSTHFSAHFPARIYEYRATDCNTVKKHSPWTPLVRACRASAPRIRHQSLMN